MKRIFFALTIMTVMLAIFAQPEIKIIEGEQMRINQAMSSVTANGDEWNVNLYMANDNDEEDWVLGSTFRRWWHVKLDGLNDQTGETLNVAIQHAGYSTIILPVWSLDGGDTYERVPLSAMPSYSSSTHSFQLVVPAGHNSIRLSKWYPATLDDLDVLRTKVNACEHATEIILGQSSQGRNMYMYELTNSAYPASQKSRVWIHSTVHPAENTAYFMAQGFLQWILDGSPEVQELLKYTIMDIIPRANPDGVYLGNYRTTAESVNMEIQFSSPYDTTVTEDRALIDKIEEFMGTESQPGENPIKLLLNLHSAHGSGGPFVYRHVPNYNSNGQGVIPSVYELETSWFEKLNARSAFSISANSSTMGARPYVESMMHDRYTLNAAWDDVMAITVEGTYQLGPQSGTICTDDDYIQLGKDMGLAIFDYFNLHVDTVVDQWNRYQQ